MGKIVVLAEKPSVAAVYAKILNCPNKHQGYYEGDEYICTHAVGHLFTLKEPQDYNEEYKNWSMDHLPIIPEKFQTKLIEDVKGQFFIIKSLVDRPDVDSIINGGDCGLEGELIQRWIILNTRTKKPVKRLWIDDLTEKSIIKGFKDLRESKEFDNYYYAANTRAKIDWCLGLSLTRCFTIKLSGRGFSGGGKVSVLSVGRCQTPILNLIVQRDEEIEDFKPIPYYEVIADLGVYKAKFIDLKNKEEGTRILNESLAEKLSAAIKGKEGKVLKVSNEVKNKKAPKLFNLTDLQKLMSNKYDFTEDKTLKVAQKLYEEYKILSYPRTSSNHLSDNIAEEFKDMFKVLSFGNFASIIEKINPENIMKVKNDKAYVDNKMITDHYALIPTLDVKKETYEKLPHDEKLLFDEIVLRFLSLFFDDYQYQSTTIITDISGFPFISKGVIELNKGWKAIYSDDEEETEGQETIEKVIEQGNIFKVVDSKMVSNKTKAPKNHTTSSILAAMQKYNIGTEATRAGIIGTLLKRGYVIRDGKKFVSTQLGRDLIHSINIDDIKSVELTATLEEKLNKILKNEVSHEDVFKEVVEELKRNVKLIKESEIAPIEKKDEVLGVCPECKGNIVSKGKFYGCTNYETLKCRFSIPGILLEADITPTQVKKLLEKNRTDLIKFKGPKGPFKARLNYNKETKKIEFVWENKKASRTK